MCRLD